MRRLFASLMVVLMLVMCIQPCFAATGDDYFTKAKMELSVSARKSGTDNAYTDALDLGAIDSPTGVDYKIDLNMSGVLAALQLAEDRTEEEIARNGRLAMDLTLTLSYPESAIINEENIKTAGNSATYNGIYKETKERVLNSASKTVVATFGLNTADLTLQNLIDNKNTYMADISVEFEDGVEYPTGAASHTISVYADGEVTLTFTNGHVRKVKLETPEPVANSVIVGSVPHALVVVPAKAATCYEDGYTESVICTTHGSYNCGANGIVPKTTIPKLVHEATLVQGKLATCTTDGEMQHYICSKCGDLFSDVACTNEVTTESLKIAKLGHDLSSTGTIVPSSCTKDGYEVQGCTRCDYTAKVIIPATGHTKQIIAAVEPTCTTAGNTAGEKCTVCGQIFKLSTVIPALGHDYGEWVITKPATESETGTKERVCKHDSSHKDVVEIPKLEHVCAPNDNATVRVEPTCTEPGSIQKYCGCGKPYGDPVVIPASGHSEDKGHVAGVASTCSTKGVMEHWSCSKCGKLFKDEARTIEVVNVILPLDSTKHTIVTIPAVESTCTRNGLTEGKKCSLCNKVTLPQTVVLAEHKDLRDVSAVPATCTETGTIAHQLCTVCNKHVANDGVTELKVSDYTAPMLTHDYHYESVEDPSTGDITTTVTCKRQDCTFSETYTQKHEHGKSTKKITVTPATCQSTGLAKVVCTSCGEKVRDEIIPRADHTLVKVEAVDSTCIAKGHEAYWYCTVCDKMFSNAAGTAPIDKIIESDRIPHNYVDQPDEPEYKVKKCTACGDTIRTKKIKVNNTDVKIEPKGEIVNDNKKLEDETKRHAGQDAGLNVVIDTAIHVEDINISNELNEKVDKPIQDNPEAKPTEEKVVLDIKVEKTTEYKSGENVVDKDIEEIPETEDVIKIDIPIPSNMQGMADYIVHRMHNGQHDTIGISGRAENPEGEYIEISPDKTNVSLYAKKFSEYALVGYTEKVNYATTSTSGGGGSSTFTVVFHANGGTVVESVKVKRGETVAEPTTTRDGYKFEGWFTDSAFTKLYDFSTPVKSSLHLYAKWVEDGNASGDYICNKFTDINIAEWYHEGVHYVIENGMMNGTSVTTFEPNTNVSRAMLVTVLWRAENMPEAVKPSRFVDLKNGQYYVDAVNWANENGVVLGTTETTFTPDASITREQFAAIMYRYAKLKGFDVSVGENTNILSYTDFDKISEYAIPALQYAAGSDLMKGKTETTLNPTDNATRAEMATILYRFFSANK